MTRILQIHKFLTSKAPTHLLFFRLPRRLGGVPPLSPAAAAAGCFEPDCLCSGSLFIISAPDGVSWRWC